MRDFQQTTVRWHLIYNDVEKRKKRVLLTENEQYCEHCLKKLFVKTNNGNIGKRVLMLNVIGKRVLMLNVIDSAHIVLLLIKYEWYRTIHALKKLTLLFREEFKTKKLAQGNFICYTHKKCCI